jgi:hypothetical protein
MAPGVLLLAVIPITSQWFPDFTPIAKPVKQGANIHREPVKIIARNAKAMLNPPRIDLKPKPIDCPT